MTVLNQVNIENETVEVEIFTKTQAGLSALREKYSEFPDPSESQEAYDQVKAGVKELTGLRTSIESTRKEVKQPYLDACRIIDGQAKGIIEQIVALEDPMKAAKKAVDEKEKREKEARIKRLKDRIEGMRHLEREARGKPSEVIEEIINEVEAIDHADFYELREEALKVREEVLNNLSAIYSDRLNYERTAAEREKERKAREEEQRVNTIKERINKCKMIPLDYMGKPVADLEKIIGSVQKMEISEKDVSEFTQEAEQAKQNTLDQLGKMLEQQRQFETMQPKEVPAEEQPEPEESAASQAAKQRKATEPEQQGNTDGEAGHETKVDMVEVANQFLKDAGLTDHQRGYAEGYVDALIQYAHWKDGKQFVGSCGTSLDEAINHFIESFPTK